MLSVLFTEGGRPLLSHIAYEDDGHRFGAYDKMFWENIFVTGYAWYVVIFNVRQRLNLTVNLRINCDLVRRYRPLTMYICQNVNVVSGNLCLNRGTLRANRMFQLVVPRVHPNVVYRHRRTLNLNRNLTRGHRFRVTNLLVSFRAHTVVSCYRGVNQNYVRVFNFEVRCLDVNVAIVTTRTVRNSARRFT